MLEYFCVSYIAEKLQNKKEKEDKKYEKFYIESQLGTSSLTSDPSTLQLGTAIIVLLVALLTARLAYECNAKSSPALRLLATIFGFFFSSIYLLYYFVKYILFDCKC